MAIIGSLCIGFGITVVAATVGLWFLEQHVQPTPQEMWLFRKPSQDEFG